MKKYSYHNNLIGKKQLRQILGWSFTNYDSMQACSLADELKYVGFKYATQAGISISIEDLRVPFSKKLMLNTVKQKISTSEKLYLKGKITDIERFQKVIDMWNLTSDSLKNQIIAFFKSYDPLNSVYIMAFSGARGNLAQVRQLVGMRGLMSDPSGEIMNLPITKNFREGLTVTDYLMSGYGARKGIVDTALKTANSGYLTRRLIDVAQDIIIREKDCYTNHSFRIFIQEKFSTKLLGRIINKPIFDPETSIKIAAKNTQLTPILINTIQQKKISPIYIRTPLTCKLYRAICQQCYGWDLAKENLVDMGEAIGILAGQSIGEPGTQLTMRTFHTGGIFTSQIQKKITSPGNGIIRFSKGLDTVPIRTNRGESVFLSKKAGSLILIPNSLSEKILKIRILSNTIIFPTPNQYVRKNSLIGEVINTNKQVKRELKPIIIHNPGEIFVPKLKTKVNRLSNNKLLWILLGNVYSSPLASYINLYYDYKLNKNSFIFRSKIINIYSGKIVSINKKRTLYERQFLIKNNGYLLKNSKFFKFSKELNAKYNLLTLNNYYYLVSTILQNQKTYLKITNRSKIAQLIINSYKTKTGGILFYDIRPKFASIYFKSNLLYIKLKLNEQIKMKEKSQRHSQLITYPSKLKKVISNIIHKTALWIEEETYFVECDSNVILVRHGDFISKNFEIIPGTFTRTSGLVLIEQYDNFVQTITVKSGLVYEGNTFLPFSNKVYFPGEVIFSNLSISKPSFCEYIPKKPKDQLLIRPIQLYEVAFPKTIKTIFKNLNSHEKNLEFKTNLFLRYLSNQIIRTNSSLDLASEILQLNLPSTSDNKLNIEIINNKSHKGIEFKFYNSLNLNNYITPKLKYKNVNSCLLVQKNQFVDQYTKLLYLEAVSFKALEIVKIKIHQSDVKSILLISNENCIKIRKNELPNKKVNDFIINHEKMDYLGKIILENKTFFTLQKGRPYFFPKCHVDISSKQGILEYKLLPKKRNKKSNHVYQKVALNKFNRLNFSFQTFQNQRDKIKDSNKNKNLKATFSKIFIKKHGRFYSSLIPRFVQDFTIGEKQNFYQYSKIFRYKGKNKKTKLRTTLLFQNSEIKSHHFSKSQFTLVKFFEYPFKKMSKSIGLYSITEDFFEEDLNSIFCETIPFLEEGYTLGLLHIEKEITGDIVQGLPRIEEILEGRKRPRFNKRIPNSQKKGLLTQNNSLTPNFKFIKLGAPIKENEKINPHKLLQVYFNYYGVKKPFFCDHQKIIKSARLTSNFEGSYKCFKKVQTFILNAVQSVYNSQGVTINDKHLEVIIKQMTTKVIITDEGDTPLLKREIIDLYHIEYLNKIIRKEKKNSAYYLPLVFGITRAALNNPSFISAASFQETTRVLTKAAIEGRIDWLRGLKENIIVGQLIPAGTGFRSYKSSFKRPKLFLNSVS